MLELSNPFATRFVQPGSLPYLLSNGQDLESLVDKFWNQCSGRAAIIGPHGSGKSTLLASLGPFLKKRGPVYRYRLSASDRDSQAIWHDRVAWTSSSTVVVDGYEQLSRWRAWQLSHWLARHNIPWLVTAHQPLADLPTLFETSIDESIALRLRDHLLQDRPALASHASLESAWKRARTAHPSDLRETWMAMYDWVEDLD